MQLKTKRKNGGENKVRWNHYGGTMQKSEFFVTGGVFLVDIGLLMGAIVFNRIQRIFIVTYETKS